jgi:hypothetical protein
LTEGIKNLDKQVAEATETRKKENEDHVVNLAANNAAVEILGFAKNRLNKFYNPKMYQAAPKRELTEEERVTLNMGGTLAPIAAPGGIAGTGVEAALVQDASVANFDALLAAKEAELEAATKAVEDKLTRVGNLGVEISTMKEDLDDTAKAMLEDKKFLAELEKGCATKQGEWDERCKTRTEELLALADTIKMLNDDDALEWFKKTCPGASAGSFRCKFRCLGGSKGGRN